MSGTSICQHQFWYTSRTMAMLLGQSGGVCGAGVIAAAYLCNNATSVGRSPIDNPNRRSTIGGCDHVDRSWEGSTIAMPNTYTPEQTTFYFSMLTNLAGTMTGTPDEIEQFVAGRLDHHLTDDAAKIGAWHR